MTPIDKLNQTLNQLKKARPKQPTSVKSESEEINLDKLIKKYGPPIRDIDKALILAKNEPIIGWDLETSGLDPFSDVIAVLQMYYPNSNSVAILHLRGYWPDDLKSLFENKSKTFIGHNIFDFDLKFLANNGVDIHQSRFIDTLVAECVVVGNGRANIRKNLQATTQRRLGKRIKKDIQHSWMVEELSDEQLYYCYEDVVYLYDLYKAQLDRAKESGQLEALKLEMENGPIICQMSINGLPLNIDRINEYISNQKLIYQQTQLRLMRDLGMINFNSPIQLKQAFSARMHIDLDNTQAETLKMIALGEDDDGIMTTLLKYRHAAKAESMYGANGIIRFADKNGFVHPSYWQVGTDTGRASSSEPNIQQQTKESGARKIFQAPDGYKIISIDYVAMEVLVAAVLAGDDLLIEAASTGDVHGSVAKYIFNVNDEWIENNKEEWKKIRKLAKYLVFTMLFGGGAATLYSYAHQSGSTISIDEARSMISEFFARFKGMANMIKFARNQENIYRNKTYIIRFPTGMRRILTGNNLRSTIILNNSVQGTAAAGLKYAINLCGKNDLSKYLIGMIHDELLFMVPIKDVDEVVSIASYCMIRGLRLALKDDSIDVRVDAQIADSWGG